MNRINYLAVKYFAILVFFISSAQSQTRPTDADLKSAYCIEYIRTDLIPSLNSLIELSRNISISGRTNEQRSSFSESEKDLQMRLEKTYQDLNRLQSYLIPRIKGMDVLGLDLAKNRAKEDSKLHLSCLPKCKGNSDFILCINSCQNSIGNPSTRMTACQSIDFLPY